MKTVYYFLVLTLLSTSILAQPGMLDQNFGNNGKVLEESFVGEPKTIIVQPDGKILVGGRSDAESDNGDSDGGFLITRFNGDGSLDTNFGDSGRNLIRQVAGKKAYVLEKMALQPDGKIIACGRFIDTSPYGIIGIVRYNTMARLMKNLVIMALF